ncbi:hypothetical protein JCM1841_006714 [Sporobolomyces salmonicolor]
MSLVGRIRHAMSGRRLLWSIFFYLGHLALFVYGWEKQEHDPRLAGLNSLKFSVWISRGAGLCLGVDGLFIVLPTLRNVLRVLRPGLTWLVPLDENIWFHRQFAYSILFWTIVHTTAHYVNFFNVEKTQIRKETAWAIHYTQPGGFTGHVMLLLMFFIYTTAHFKIRQQCFEVFWYTHHLVVLFLIGLYVHAAGCFVRGALPGQEVRCLGYHSWAWAIWGGLAYSLERLVREIRSRRPTKIVGVLMHPGGAMELRFVKPSFRYKAGQWVFLNVPDISALQYHPFTISSAPDDPYISVHIRQAGDWTIALGERLGCTPSVVADITRSACGKTWSTSHEKQALDRRSLTFDGDYFDVASAALAAGGMMPVLRVDGPFGAPAEDVFKAEVAVLVGTGIGVTPFASILKNIWYKQRQNHLGALRRVHFVWINRDTGNFEWFQSLLKRLEEAQTDPDFLTIDTYLTQHVDEGMLANIAIHDDAAVDPLTQLRARTQFGRPDFASLFRTIRQKIELGTFLPGRESSLTTTVGGKSPFLPFLPFVLLSHDVAAKGTLTQPASIVYYCGPPALAKKLQEQTKGASSTSVRFTFAKEHF